MTSNPKIIIPFIALTAVLAIGPVAPEAGNILFLVAGGTAIAFMWPGALRELVRPVAWMPLAGLALIAVAYTASAGVAGLSGLLYFTPMLAVWPLLAAFRGTDLGEHGLLLGILALCGASGAAIMALSEVQATGTVRAGAAIANPIHFADVALLVGFLGLIGMAFARSYWRILFVVAPIMSVIAVALSGTRGAVVAVMAMLLAFAVSIAAVQLVSRRLVLAGTVVLVAIGALALAVGGSQISGIERVLSDIAETLAHGAPTDNSTDVRLQMYLGGARAVLEAPIFGHGPLAFTAVADSLADMPFGNTPHLHNDIIDMAASGGILGLTTYFLMVLAPLVEAFRAPASAVRPWTIVLASTLVTGFFVMGLTNAMFGILTVTTSFAAVCVMIGMLGNSTVSSDAAEAEATDL
ncbi:O-antigen ligase family protein [Devosia sp. CAU 1758]